MTLLALRKPSLHDFGIHDCTDFGDRGFGLILWSLGSEIPSIEIG
jgi:hypothetical protein